MARILALDYGETRTGVAVTDDLQLIASGLTTIPTATLLSFLKEYMAKEQVELLLIGEPKRHSGEHSAIENAIQTAIKNLRKALPRLPVKRVDERFTSKMASKTMIDGGLKKRQRSNKALADEISATIILQSYLYYQ